MTAASFIALVSDTANTAVALLSPELDNGPAPAGNGATQVDLMVVDRLGEVVAEETVLIDAGNKIAVFLDQLVPGLEDFTGSFEVHSDLPVAILPLRQEGIQLTTQELHPARQLPE